MILSTDPPLAFFVFPPEITLYVIVLKIKAPQTSKQDIKRRAR